MSRALAKKEQESHRDLEDERCCTLYLGDPNIYPVDEILDVRSVATKIEYLVKWTGYSSEYNEWVSERDVTTDLKRAFSRGRKKNVWKWLKVSRSQAKLENYSTTTKSDTLSTTIKTVTKHEIFESFEEKTEESRAVLYTAMKKEENH